MKSMQWKRTNNGSNTSGLELWLSLDGHKWYPYTHSSFNYLRQPEINIEGASHGYSTAQYCLKLNFKYITTDN